MGYVVIRNAVYLMKKQYLFQIMNALTRSMENLHKKEMLAYMNKKLSSLYIMDTLTGMYNRMGYQQLGEKAFRISRRNGRRLLILFVDLDRLKYINDTFGHQEGDAYIRFFVRIVNENIREEDIFARIGGDEFCILMRDCAGDDARKRLSDIQKQFVLREKKNYARSFSCGIVGVPRNHDKVDLDTLLHEADEVMYDQKREHKKEYQSELGI